MRRDGGNGLMPADDTSGPVVERSVFASSDPEETAEFFRQMYVGNHTAFSDVGGF